MPTYAYKCPKCGTRFEEIKGIKAHDADPSAKCGHCGYLCGRDDRDFSNATFSFIGTSVESAEYNPGLGTVVKNKHHKQEILKKKNLVEVGNDFGSAEKMQKHYETRKKEEREKRWADPKEFFL